MIRAQDAVWIERRDDGHDHVLAAGRRLVASGATIASVAPPGPEVDGGARAPSWLSQGPARYVFWRGQKLYAADRFDGELVPLATLPARVRESFDWLDGTGLLLAGGALLVPTAGGAPRRLGVPPLRVALAADARRAVAITAFGRALLTTDGGATFRDADDLRGAASLEARGDEIAAVFRDGHDRFVTASGAVAATASAEAPRSRRPDPPLDPFPGGLDAALRAVGEGGELDGHGGVIVSGPDVVGRFDPVSLRTTSLAALAVGPAAHGDCAAFRAPDAPLLVCAGEGHAVIVDLTGAPRVERAFAYPPESELDRFVGADGHAVGFLGPCSGAPEPDLPTVDAFGATRQHSAVFCVREGRETYVEHRLDPADASDVIAWIPRAGGGAVALVARPGALLDDRERVSVRGALRVVRVARSEPPLAMSDAVSGPSEVLSRAFRARADDVVEGWLRGHGEGGVTALTIDAGGHVGSWPLPPGITGVAFAGRFALAAAESGVLWETVDFGHRWASVEPPPSAGPDLRPVTSTCSPAGCVLGPYTRLGWSAPDPPPPIPDLTAPPLYRSAPRSSRAAPEALLRIACAAAGPTESRRVTDSGGFGFTATAQPRSSSPSRIGSVGVAMVPHAMAQGVWGGNLEVAWIAPLDVSARLRRASIPLSLLDPSRGRRRLRELHTGFMLGARGLEVFSTSSPSDACADRAFARSGLTRALGSCPAEPSVAVEIGGHVVVASHADESLVVSTFDGAGRTREIARAAVPLRGMLVGSGARGTTPVVVLVGVDGSAALASIDLGDGWGGSGWAPRSVPSASSGNAAQPLAPPSPPNRGALGPEERLRALPDALLGTDPGCAPQPDDARVVLPFEGAIAIDRASLRGVVPAAGGGVAIVRWSASRACIDAVELPIRDQRFDERRSSYDPPGPLRKLIARFEGKGPGRGVLVSVGLGSEVRQKVVCTGIAR